MLYEVRVTGGASFYTDTAPVLGPVFGEGSPLDLTHTGNRYHDILISEEVLGIELISIE